MIASLLLIITLFLFAASPVSAQAKPATWWPVQSVDTMKYSRDLAQKHLNDSNFDQVIDLQVKVIAATGATHISLGTPYDPEFVPFLTRWVAAARRYGLKVWFRGNLSGWEGWFGYSRISREQHLFLLKEFLYQNANLFQDGDIFTSCPECENGGPGDPRHTGDVVGFRQFLEKEYELTRTFFADARLQVASNYFSMNGDVAKLVMDRPTTESLDGIVTIDHYVSSPHQLASDIEALAKSSGGKIVLGEFGAPIPDIHGRLTPSQQAEWLDQALNLLSQLPQLAGINYWVGFGGSTALWSEDGQPFPAVAILTQYYKPLQFTGQVINTLYRPLPNVSIYYRQRLYSVSSDGSFSLPAHSPPQQVLLLADGYADHGLLLTSTEDHVIIKMSKDRSNFLYRMLELILSLTHSILKP